MPLTADQERWAEALAIERQYGAGAPAFIAERIAALARSSDTAGVERFRQIAARLDQLREPRHFLLT
jgi:HPt (histidine-containing phosphotransfer) domain-containing protein